MLMGFNVFSFTGNQKYTVLLPACLNLTSLAFTVVFGSIRQPISNKLLNKTKMIVFEMKFICMVELW